MTARRKRKAKPQAAAPAQPHGTSIDDMGIAAQIRVSTVVPIGGEKRSGHADGAVYVRRFAVECTIDEIHANGRVTDRQWAAGIKFRHNWLRAVRHAPVTSLYGERTPGSDTTTTQAIHECSARVMITEAIRAVGMIASAAIIATCGEDEQPRRLETLTDALTALAEHWKLDPSYTRDEKRG